MTQVEEKCLIHRQTLKAYCLDDGKFLCVDCLIENKHKNHSFLKIEE